MSRATRTIEPASAPPAALALRRLAADLRTGGDLRHLVVALRRALPAFPGLHGLEVEEPGAEGFPADRLTLPMIGSAGPVGLMRMGVPARGEFTRAQLQLAGAVADIASVVMEHALQARDPSATRDLLAVALGDLPWGLACYDASGALLFANSAAHHFAGGRLPVDWNSVWTTLAPAARRTPGTTFVRRDGSRLVHVAARRPVADGPGAIVFMDLAPRVVSFGETLAAEVYRCLVERRDLALGVLAGPEGSPDALGLVEAARARLPAGTRFGPIDAEAAGVIVPGVAATELWRELRAIVAGASAEGMRGGVAALRGEGDTPEALVARTTAALQPIAAHPLPELLVCDLSESVTEALTMMLRRDFVVTAANEWERTVQLVDERAFDGAIFELPPTPESPASRYLRRALGTQPALRPFFVTDQPGPWELPSFGLPPGPVFRKPFVVGEIRSAVREAFAGAK